MPRDVSTQVFHVSVVVLSRTSMSYYGADSLKQFDGVNESLKLSLKHVDGWLYRASTVVSNVTDQAFRGIPSLGQLTLTHAKLKSLSYAFPRYTVRSVVFLRS